MQIESSSYVLRRAMARGEMLENTHNRGDYAHFIDVGYCIDAPDVLDAGASTQVVYELTGAIFARQSFCFRSDLR